MANARRPVVAPTAENGYVDTGYANEGRLLVGLLDAEDVIPGWAAGLLTMEGLKASATVKKRGSDVDFKLLRAEGGSLALHGRLRKSGARDPAGAFLVRSGVLSVGIDIEQDGTGVKLLAGESWVNEKMAALDR